jgi:hypothetical protein
MTEAGAETGCRRHAAHHRLRGSSPQGHHRTPGLLRLGIGQIGRDLALPYGDPILSQSPEIVLRRAIRFRPRPIGPRRFVTIIHALCFLLRRRQVVPGFLCFNYA